MKRVPDVVGLRLGDALSACREAGFGVIVKGTAAPRSVSPPGGAERVLRTRLVAPDAMELLVAAEAPTPASRSIPRHIAIICDGNGRWALARGLPRSEGHRAGTENVKRVVTWCAELGVEYLSLFVFSTENWRRPKDEVDALMDLISDGVRTGLDELLKSGVRVRVLGEPASLPREVREVVEKITAAPAAATGMVLNLLFNYGGRAEIVAACRELARAASSGEVRAEDIDERLVSSKLFTAGLPDPELIIRTAGELRLSNFLLWQGAYSELHFTPVTWPDFARADLLWAIDDYSRRHRRFGGLEGDGCSCSAPGS